MKAGDKVRYVKAGPIGWESVDWARNGGLTLGKVYTVRVSQVEDEAPSVKIEECTGEFNIHPDHFEAVAGENSKMTKVTVFGQEENRGNKKIEFVKFVTDNGVLDSDNKPDHYDNVCLLGKQRIGTYDLIMAWDNVESSGKRIYLGHWNDGIV